MLIRQFSIHTPGVIKCTLPTAARKSHVRMGREPSRNEAPVADSREGACRKATAGAEGGSYEETGRANGGGESMP